MKKDNILHYIDRFPDFFSFASGHFKKLLDENGKDILDQTNGTIGLFIKIFGKPIINKYFEGLSDIKLDNFGYSIYLKSSLIQGEKSLEYISNDFEIPLANEDILDKLSDSIDMQTNNFDSSKLLLVFKPTQHPAIIVTKEIYIRVLSDFKVNSDAISAFQHHFNSNIGEQIKCGFGSDYEKHLEQVKKERNIVNEINFLKRMKDLDAVGFHDNENLGYETTYATWERASNLNKNTDYFKDDLINDVNEKIEKILEIEKTLEPIENLIHKYFNPEESNFINKILFIIADFGKGKTVFMKHYASELAKNYLRTGEGLFPVYFNLADYNKYSYNDKDGVIDNYLKQYAEIDLNEDYYKNREYIFLLDSLDESVEVDNRSVDVVINSIKKVQSIDFMKYTRNRVVIATRPFSDKLEKQINMYSYKQKNSQGREDGYFISLYGFKKDQFNNWLNHSLRNYNLSYEDTKGFIKKIIDEIHNENFDIYKEFLKKQILSYAELRRPIFAYMILKLIVDKVESISLKKLKSFKKSNLFISFINLLTKEAKHIDDKSQRINLEKEYEFRSILHSIAALWMYKHYRGEHNTFDISAGSFLNDKNTRGDILRCYLGENENKIFFYHQSFAEFLLAEYYVKVFIKFALSEKISDDDVERARINLMLGEPTGQTIEFFIELLNLLNECWGDSSNQSIIEKRELLLPLLASLGVKSERKGVLYSKYIHDTWYKYAIFDENVTIPPKELQKGWIITKNEIDKILELAGRIVESDKAYINSRIKTHSTNYDSDVVEFEGNLYDLTQDIDRWLALLVGNVLGNDKQTSKLFNGKIKKINKLFNMIKFWNYSHGTSVPTWGRNLFNGIHMEDNSQKLLLNNTNFSGIDFSYSYLNNIVACNSNFEGCQFNNVKFKDVVFRFSNFTYSTFKNIVCIEGNFDIYFSMLLQGLLIPKRLCELLINTQDVIEGNYDNEPVFINKLYEKSVFDTLEGLLVYVIKNKNITTDEIKKWFRLSESSNPILESSFLKKIDSLKKYEK